MWEPIGPEYCPFKGTFEGNGHKITGIYINSEENYQGFFGQNKGTIKNLGIENGYIYTNGLNAKYTILAVTGRNLCAE